MKKKTVPTLALLLAAAAAVAAQPATSPRLAFFEPLAGRTWKATLPNGAVDVHRFDFVLGGQVLRSVHSVNDGAYGGVAHVYWDGEKQALASHYVTTAGFFTTGAIRIENGAILSHEIVHGGRPGGVTEVKAESRLTDGKLVVRSRQLVDGTWSEPSERVYVEDPKAKVSFEP